LQHPRYVTNDKMRDISLPILDAFLADIKAPAFPPQEEY
jgi:hypothetical protein